MEDFIVIFCSKWQEIVITLGSDQWTHLLLKSQNPFIWSNEKKIVNLTSNKFEDNNNSIFQLNNLQNSLLMSIVDTPEKDVCLSVGPVSDTSKLTNYWVVVIQSQSSG